MALVGTRRMLDIFVHSVRGKTVLHGATAPNHIGVLRPAPQRNGRNLQRNSRPLRQPAFLSLTLRHELCRIDLAVLCIADLRRVNSCNDRCL